MTALASWYMGGIAADVGTEDTVTEELSRR